MNKKNMANSLKIMLNIYYNLYQIQGKEYWKWVMWINIKINVMVISKKGFCFAFFITHTYTFST